MIKLERTDVMNMENAIRGMRNPMNSWDKSDSMLTMDPYYFAVGPNDLDLAQRLCKAGSDHRKFLRQIFVSVDITAPRSWWAEYATYKVGTCENSQSTMHCIHKEPFKAEDFSIENLKGYKREIEQFIPEFDLDLEVWRTYPHNELYLVSNFGRIKRLSYKTRHNRTWSERILTNTKTNDGYLKVGIVCNGIYKDVRVHRMVAETFIDNPNDKPHVNHINGNKLDNRTENLEWCTAKENISHSYENNLQPIQVNTYKGKLTNWQRKEIVTRYNSEEISKRRLALEYGVSHTTISAIVNNKYSYKTHENEYRKFKETLDQLNYLREMYLDTGDKNYWRSIIDILPQSYNQMRTCTMTYENLRNMYHARKNHKLDEWHTFCEWVETLPYATELITGGVSNE